MSVTTVGNLPGRDRLFLSQKLMSDWIKVAKFLVKENSNFDHWEVDEVQMKDVGDQSREFINKLYTRNFDLSSLFSVLETLNLDPAAAMVASFLGVPKPSNYVPSPIVGQPSVPLPFVPLPFVPLPSVPLPTVKQLVAPVSCIQPSVPLPFVLPSVPLPSVPLPSAPLSPIVGQPSVPLPFVPSYLTNPLHDCLVNELYSDWRRVAMWLEFKHWEIDSAKNSEGFVNALDCRATPLDTLIDVLMGLKLIRAAHAVLGITSNSQQSRPTSSPMQQSFVSPPPPMQSPMQLEIPTGEDEETDNEEKTCIICLNNLRKCVIKDCGHAVLCITCSKTILVAVKKECPQCRKEIKEGIIRFYD